MQLTVVTTMQNIIVLVIDKLVIELNTCSVGGHYLQTYFTKTVHHSSGDVSMQVIEVFTQTKPDKGS